jgi:hypothetical protein
MTKPTKNQHFIPQSILRRFCSSGETIFLFDGALPEKGIRPKNIDRVHQRFHSNSYKKRSGRFDDSVEQKLAREVDDRFAPALERLKNSVDIGELVISSEDRSSCLTYVASSVVRNPNLKDAMLKMLDLDTMLADTVDELGISEHDLLSNWTEDDDPPQSIVQYLSAMMSHSTPEDLLGRLAAFSFFAAFPSNDFDLFVLGDFPMMRYDNPVFAENRVMSEIWTIVDPRLAIGFVETPMNWARDDFLIALSKERVAKINNDFAARSKQVAGKCPIHLFFVTRDLGLFPRDRFRFLPE